MNRYSFSSLIAIILALPVTAMAGANPCLNGFRPPRPKPFTSSVNYDAERTHVIIHRGMNGAAIHLGLNVVDDPATLNCHSVTGCLLVATGEVTADNAGYIKCTFLDGEPILGRWQILGGAPDFDNKRLSAGKHTVQTELYVVNTGGSLLQWALEYTLYDRKK